jgi:glyoxylase-like metal-dependent hydrolase (beta-lactamase superfamily II)
MNPSDLHVAESVYVVGCSEWNGIRALTRCGGSANVFLLDGGSELALIDTGCTEGVKDVLGNIQSLGLDLKKIRKIILTHGHWDHVEGTAELLKTLDCTVYGHALSREVLAGRPGIYQPDYQFLKSPPAPVHELIKEGDTIRVGDFQLRVLEVPGHTPDGLAFTFDLPRGGGVGCFSGDTAIGDQAGAKGVIGWIDARWNTKLSDFKRSLERLRALELAALFPGHGYAHLGQDDVRTSIDNCLWRLNLLLSIPHLGTMTPVMI